MVLLTTGKGQAWHWASLLRLLLLGAWGSLCRCWTPAALGAGTQGSSLAHAPAGGWSRSVGPAVRFDSSPLVARSVGKGIQQGPMSLSCSDPSSELLDLSRTVHMTAVWVSAGTGGVSYWPQVNLSSRACRNRKVCLNEETTVPLSTFALFRHFSRHRDAALNKTDQGLGLIM